MTTTTKTTAPAVGSLVRRSGGSITYRVTESRATGCNAEATVDEVVPSQTYGARQPRKLLGSEKRISLAVTECGLIDSRWNAWEVVA